MKWFKHMAFARKSDGIQELMEEFGKRDGYAMYFLLLEYCAEKFDAKKGDANFKIRQKDLHGLLEVKAQKCRRFLTSAADLGLFEFAQSEKFYEIYFPKLLKIKDEYARKSGQGPDKAPDVVPAKARTKLKLEEELEGTGTEGLFPSDSSPPNAPPKKKTSKPKPKSKSAAAWKAYSDAYFNRYGLEPPRNARVNAQMAQIVSRIGEELSPALVKFYVELNTPFYVRSSHTLGPLLKDCEGLMVQMKSGKSQDVPNYQKSHGQALKDLKNSNPYRRQS